MRGEEFERLYELHARPLYGFLAYRTGDRVLAEDLLADTFERVLRSRTRFDPRRGSEKRWLYAIALNLLRDNLRRRSSEQRALERTAARVVALPAEEHHVVESRDTVGRALRILSDEEREAIAL